MLPVHGLSGRFDTAAHPRHTRAAKIRVAPVILVDVPIDDDTCRHFSLCNPQGRTQGDLPKLLRRLATQIANLGPNTMILDVTIAQEITADGPWFTATVYYAPDGWIEEV